MKYSTQTLKVIGIIGIPLLVLIGTLLFLPFTNLESSPEYDLIYTPNSFSRSGETGPQPPNVYVSDGNLVIDRVQSPNSNLDDLVVYRYDPDSNTSTQLSLEEIESIPIVDVSQTSPDGFSAECSRSPEGIPPFGYTRNDCSQYVLVKGAQNREISLEMDQDPQYPSQWPIRILGWAEKN